MTKVQIKATFAYDIHDVWNTVTDLNNQLWRHDIEKIEIIDNQTFIEYTKDGYSTTFTITKFVPYKQYEFDIHNENMSGHYSGIFSFHNSKTSIEFTEDITTHKIYLKPFVKTYLKKQQKAYIKDLQNALKSNKL